MERPRHANRQQPGLSVTNNESSSVTEDEDNVDEETDHLSQILFLRLDPLLRILLNMIQKHQQLLATTSHSSSSSSSGMATMTATAAGAKKKLPPELHKSILDSLQTQSDLLERLADTVQALAWKHGQEDNDNKLRLVTSLAALAKYLSLPSLALLRLLPEEDDDAYTNNNDIAAVATAPSKSNAQRILQSATRKTLTSAVQVLVVLLDCMQHPGDGKKESRLDTALSIKIMSACAARLPSGKEVVAAAGAASQSNDSSLDRGHAWLHTLLVLLGKLAQQGSNNDDAFVNEVTSYLDGALVARVADTCVALVIPPMPAKQQDGGSPISVVVVREYPAHVTQQALLTLRVWLEALPRPRQWQRLFPGLFAGLYRRLIVSLRVANARTNEAAAALQTMSSLMHATLSSSSTTTTLCPTKDPMAVLASLAAGAQTSNKDVNNKNGGQGSFAPLTVNKKDQESSPFVLQMEQRTPAPLVTLVHLLPLHQSSKVRLEATGFLRVLLLDTSAFWKAEAFRVLNDAAMDTCVALTCDADASVAAAAHQVLDDQNAGGGTTTSSSTSSATTLAQQRIGPLMQDLQTLAMSRRRVELRSRMQLVTGYLRRMHGASSNKSARKDLQRLLLDENDNNGDAGPTLRQTLATLLELDTKSLDGGIILQPRPPQAMTATTSAALVAGMHTRPKGPTWQYLADKEIRATAVEMLHWLGKAAGPKVVAAWVDAVTASLYRSSAACIGRRRAPNVADEQRVQDGLGSLVACKEFIVGAFGLDSTSAKTKQRVLLPLTTAILPILTSRVLLDPPRHVAVETADQLSKHRLLESCAATNSACQVVLLLELIQTLFVHLAPMGNDLLPSFLYPIVTCLDSSSQTVRDMAMFTLGELAMKCGYGSITNMMHMSLPNLTSVVLSKLRLPGGQIPSRDDTASHTGLLIVVRTSTLVLNMTLASSKQQSFQTPGLENVLELVGALTGRFDYIISSLARDAHTALSFLGAFQLGMQHLVHWIKDNMVDQAPSLSTSTEPWINLLSAWKIERQDDVCNNMPPTAPAMCKTGAPKDVGEDALVSLRQTNFVASLISRLGVLLSHHSLAVQVACCKVLCQCFLFLGLVSTTPAREDEQNGVCNASLRHAAECWPVIVARLKAATAVVKVSSSVTSLQIVGGSGLYPSSGSDNKQVGLHRVFLAQLFELIATITEHSDDFLSSRLQTDVWPCISQILHGYVDGSGSGKRESTKPQQSETNLLCSIMELIASIFGHRPVGVMLNGIIPKTGIMILPYLDWVDGVSLATLEAMKAMIQIDCDCLKRPLSEMSGVSLPTSPLLALSPAQSKSNTTTANNQVVHLQQSRLSLHAAQLLDFIGRLPEQEITY